ncbi:MAG TPA: DUF433 domain-containing protein [Thermoanaerobaculia bacterium]|nr:DUF433 domain-containing protein [Thermoanaerobaculia bacterium]
MLNVPAYPLSEAARYLRVSQATLRSWFIGRPYPTSRGTSRFEPLLKPAGVDPAMLSFSNLIESHVLRSLRTEFGVPLTAVRQALGYAERELNIHQLLLREELRTSGGALFLERYRELIKLSASGQLVMRKLFEAHLARVEWGKLRSAVRLYPFVFGESIGAKPIVIDPTIAFGRPVVNHAFVSTRSILERIDAGESVQDVANDYELSVAAVEEAVVFERAA